MTKHAIKVINPDFETEGGYPQESEKEDQLLHIKNWCSPNIFRKVNQKHLICYRYYLFWNSGYLPTHSRYPDKEWFHLIINYHGPSGGICIYHGNENKGCSSGEYSGSYSTGDGHVVLGRYFTDTDDAQYYASGSVDELMFFNATLSDSDIEALVNLYKWDVSHQIW